MARKTHQETEGGNDGEDVDNLQPDGGSDEGGSDRQAVLIAEFVSDRQAEKAANFRRLANRRVSLLISGFKALRQLCNTASYDWTQEQHDKIFGALEDKFIETMEAFSEAKKPKEKKPRKLKKQMEFEL